MLLPGSCVYGPVMILSLLASDQDRNAETAGVASTAYQANRDSFSSVTCRFRVCKGSAESETAAVRGEIDVRIKGVGLLIISGDEMRYELRWDEKVMAEALQEGQKTAPENGISRMVIPAASLSLLSGRLGTLRFAPEIQGANLYAPGSKAPGTEYTPWGMCVFELDESNSPGSVLRKCSRGELACRVLEDTTIDGKPVLGFGVGWSADDIRIRYYLDPERAFLPLQAWGRSDASGRLAYRVHTRDIARCSGDRWFPTHSVAVWSPEEAGKVNVDEIRVEELNVDSPPNRSMFALDLPEPVQLSMPGINDAAIILRKPTKIHLDDLESWRQRCAARAKNQFDLTSAARPRTSGGRLVLLVSTVFIVGFAIRYLLKRRTKSL